MKTIQFNGITVQVIEAEFSSIAYGRRPATRSKATMYSAQRPNGTWESMCGSPSEAVRAMQIMWQAKN